MALQQQEVECVTCFNFLKSDDTVHNQFQTKFGDIILRGDSETSMWQLCDERLHWQGRSFSQPLVSETVEWTRAAFVWSPYNKSEKPELD